MRVGLLRPVVLLVCLAAVSQAGTSFLDTLPAGPLDFSLPSIREVTGWDQGARPERPFAFEHVGVLLHGRLDVLWQSSGKALVVDYKSNALDDTDPASVVEAEYRLQRLVYALACLRAGASEVEIAYQFLERPTEVVSTTFTTKDTPGLEAELSAVIDRIRAGEFRPTPSEFACADCPALDLVCAGPRLRAPAHEPGPEREW